MVEPDDVNKQSTNGFTLFCVVAYRNEYLINFFNDNNLNNLKDEKTFKTDATARKSNGNRDHSKKRG